MAGFELESLERAAPDFSNVLVAEILSAEPHPQADKLRVCRVSTGQRRGAADCLRRAQRARRDSRARSPRSARRCPVRSRSRRPSCAGSNPRACSPRPRSSGWRTVPAGILELPADAPVGQPLREYLDLDEPVLDLNVTPNRGDAMSVLGVAREVAALTGGCDHRARRAQPSRRRARSSWP